MGEKENLRPCGKFDEALERSQGSGVIECH
jgi:hypothetical protein